MPSFNKTFISSTVCLILPIFITVCAGRPMPLGEDQHGQHHPPRPHHGPTHRTQQSQALSHSVFQRTTSTAPQSIQRVQQILWPSERVGQEQLRPHGSGAFDHVQLPPHGPPSNPPPAIGPLLRLDPPEQHRGPSHGTASPSPAPRSSHGRTQPHQQILIPSFGTPQQAGRGGLDHVYHFQANQSQSRPSHNTQPQSQVRKVAPEPPRNPAVSATDPAAAPPHSHPHGQLSGHQHVGASAAGPSQPQAAQPPPAGAGSKRKSHWQGNREQAGSVKCPEEGCNYAPMETYNIAGHLARKHQWGEGDIMDWKHENGFKTRKPRNNN